MKVCALSRAASRARPSTFKPALRSPRPGAPPPASAARRSPRPRPRPAPRTPAWSNKGPPESRPRTCLAHSLYYFCILDLWGPCPAKRCPITEHVALSTSLVSSLGLHKLLHGRLGTLPATNLLRQIRSPPPYPLRPVQTPSQMFRYGSRSCLLHTPLSHRTLFLSSAPFPFQCTFFVWSYPLSPHAGASL